MTSQKTIERCRARVKELEEANATLLNNNVVMAESNKTLRGDIEAYRKANETLKKDLESAISRINEDSKHIRELADQKDACKRKCEVIISEKDRLLQEKERRLAGVRPTFEHLKNAEWFYRLNQLPDGRVEIIHTVKFR